MRDLELGDLRKYVCSNILGFYVLMILSVAKVTSCWKKESHNKYGEGVRVGQAGEMTWRERRQGDRTVHRVSTGDSGPELSS